MKSCALRLLAVCFIQGISILEGNAQPAPGTQTATNLVGDYTISQVGPHSRIWQNTLGQSVTEIATGLNYWNGAQWMPSQPMFVRSADGSGFEATRIQDPTRLAANLNSQGAVSVTTPDGVVLKSTPLAIGLFDAASGKSVILATVTNSIGTLVDSRDVVYDRALVGEGLAASVVYSLPDAGSFHQDIVFVGFDPSFNPTNWGFGESSTNTLRIQIFTEFYDPPQPLTIMQPLYVEPDPEKRAAMASPDLIDYMLDFGDYTFELGRAYTAGTNDAATAGVTVAKEFVTQEGRTFLVESVPFGFLQGALRALPAAVTKTSKLILPGTARKTRFAANSVPAPAKSAVASVALLAAATSSAIAKPHGVTVDYVVTVSSSAPTLYAADTTYYVSGTVHNTAAVTMESAVFKYPTNNAGAIEISGALTLATANYRPAIFTAADDNTAGASLSTTIWSNYTANPTGKYYGNIDLWLNTTANIALNNLRFAYARIALEISANAVGQTLSLSHSQLIDCINGIYVSGGNGSGSGSDSLTLSANNCLMANVEYPLQAFSIIIGGSAYNCTFDAVTQLAQFDGASAGSFAFTNSIFSGVASKGTLNSVTLNGGYNGYYSSPTIGTPATTAGSWPYQSLAAGSYYLPTNSSFLTLGTTNITASLRKQLQSKTTRVPLLLTSTITANTNLAPTIARDTNATMLGFHYDPIDYFSACAVSNSTLTLTNGVALAYYSNSGICLQDGSHLASGGSALQRDVLAYYGSVQEQPTNFWGVTNAVARSVPIAPAPFGSSSDPSIFLQFTSIFAPTGETNLLNTGDSGEILSGLVLRDCEIYGSGANWQMAESNNAPNVALTNNLFHRVPFAINSHATIDSFNNLFYASTNTNTTVSIHHRNGTNTNIQEDNVFDGVSVSMDGATLGHNAYLHGATNATYQSGDIVTNISWQAGALGSFYQPTNSPLLAAGSRSAGLAGLVNYTVKTNNVCDGTGMVSIGYHYVGLGTNQYPIGVATNCVTAPSVNLLSLTTPIQVACLGFGEISNAFSWALTPGTVAGVTNSNGSDQTYTQTIYSTVLTNWNVLNWNGSISTNAGSICAFASPTVGAGSNIFYVTYQNEALVVESTQFP
jgi:hypothetical protein